MSRLRIQSLVQAADYPDTEYNPRGCLRGQSSLNLIYGPDRLKQPLIRVGKRGEGKFKAVSWDEALDHVADKLAGIMQKYGPESVVGNIQVPGTGYVHKGALMRLASMNEWSIIHAYTMNGDLPAFWPMTFGVQTEELESLEWTNSKYTMILGSNVMVTRVPDAKFLNISRENGNKVVVVDPNYSPTAAKADEWIQINPSTDAAFALGIVNVILNEKLYDAVFIKTYTDMPLLVRLDNNEIAVVFRPNRENGDAPIVKVVLDAAGRRLENPRVQGLEHQGGTRYASIVDVVDPSLKNIDVASYLN